jgi:uncharacterized phage protein (TIGR01671 family)
MGEKVRCGGGGMREIKFRVWDKDKEIMVDWNNIKIGLVSGYNGCPVQTYNFYDLDNSQHLVFMQFTGLKDKNGKEIYEGDRVNVFRTDSFIAYRKAVVVYSPNHGAFLVQYEKIAHDGKIKYSSCADWEIEVIGNIWEDEE